ncbi:MAG: ParB/RepB/Spo0J family partition protein [bacterium]
MKTNRVLGRGLSALIEGAAEVGRLGDREARMVPLNALVTNPNQPRKLFDDNKLQELAASIEQVGLLQPVLVRRCRTGEGVPMDATPGGAQIAARVDATQAESSPRYMLVAGERRIRAARLAGLEEVPAIICTFAETEALKIALLENIQREDLGPIEEAMAYQNLLEAYGATQDELAAMLGINRSSVANTVRLLALEKAIQDLLESREISRGHAKVLLGMPPGDERVRLARLCRSRGLSVRECEKRVQQAGQDRAPTKQRRRKSREETPEVRALREMTEQALGSPVQIDRDSKSGKGTIAIKFFSDADLERLLEIMGVDTDLS